MKRRLKMEIRGAVQGVGFRPFVYRLATGLGLSANVAAGLPGLVDRVVQEVSRLGFELHPRSQVDLSERRGACNPGALSFF